MSVSDRWTPQRATHIPPYCRVCENQPCKLPAASLEPKETAMPNTSQCPRPVDKEIPMFRPNPDQLSTLILALQIRAERSAERGDAHVANTYRWVMNALRNKDEYDRLIASTLAYASGRE